MENDRWKNAGKSGVCRSTFSINCAGRSRNVAMPPSMSRLPFMVDGYVFTLMAVVMVRHIISIVIGCAIVPNATPISLLGHLDGMYYKQIVACGYSVPRDGASTALFFPGYPEAASLMYECGFSTSTSLLTVSWLSFAVSLIAANHYFYQRCGHELGRLALAALAVNPMTFYMLCMYTEAMFLLCTIALLEAVRLKAHPMVVACICGALTGIRSCGVCAVPVAVLYSWMHSDGVRAKVGWALLSLIVGSWGIMLFCARLQYEVGDGFAFIRSQGMFERPGVTWRDKILSIVSLGPMRRLYEAQSIAYLRRGHPGYLWVFSNQCGDACAWAAFGVLIVVGWYRSWINAYETCLSMMLFAFATWFQADRSDMMCQGRYMSVIVPVYICLGRVIGTLPHWMRIGLVATALGLGVSYAVGFFCGRSL